MNSPSFSGQKAVNTKFILQAKHGKTSALGVAHTPFQALDANIHNENGKLIVTKITMLILVFYFCLTFSFTFAISESQVISFYPPELAAYLGSSQKSLFAERSVSTSNYV
jgi:hypothetical protein